MELKDLISYQELQKKDTTLFSQVNEIYDMVKETVNSISGCFNNYTMHDMGHGLRVASYMEQLAFGIDENQAERVKKFNAAELAVLILVALLHDIGMFISANDKEEIKNENIKYSDNLTFQGVLEVKNGNEEEAIKEIVRITHAARINKYINHKFSDKSIADILRIDNKYSYSEDIALICQAHGENYDYIKNNLRTSTTKGMYEFNQQYFAVLLRIADYLDLDRQRTPILWFSMMGIEGYSKSEWETHFQISNEKKLKMHFDGKMQIFFDGKSSNAKIHRKYLKYIDNLKKELENADLCLNNKDSIEKYKLNVTTKIDDMVLTEGFKYSDLRLNLDYAAITELLMGQNIYGDKKLGLRELLQNSIDACKIMKEVNSDFSIDANIKIIISENENYVKIKDTGIGMTIDVIKNHFLNVGKSYYKSNEYLFNNFNYKPIGQYGIGFLACFLLSDNIIVKTRHYKSDETCQIELEKNSEYVVTNTQTSTLFYGTEISLEYNSFMNIFKSIDNLKSFIENYFFTDINIEIIVQDKKSKYDKLQNNNLSLINKMILNDKKNKFEIIDCLQYSDCVEGKIILKSEPYIYDKKIESFENKDVFIYDNSEGIFKKINKIPNGYYDRIEYTEINDFEYDRILKSKKEIHKKIDDILSLGKINNKIFYLLIKFEDSFLIHRYHFEHDSKKEEKLKEIFSKSNLNFYPELLQSGYQNSIFSYGKKYIHLYDAAYFSKFWLDNRIADGFEFNKSYLYYKDILVRDFGMFSTLIPYNLKVGGCINYFKNNLKLTVSRNDISEGYQSLCNEFMNILLKYKLSNEKDDDVKKFLSYMLEFKKEKS